MQTQKADMPILGIEYEEQRETKENVTQTGHAGPCTGCDTIAWLSHKSEEKGYLCGSCWYGPQWEGTDPVVQDIERLLLSTWRELASQTLEGIEDAEEGTHIINGATIEDVATVICPHCYQEVDHCKLTAFGQWACPDCIEEQAEALEVEA